MAVSGSTLLILFMPVLCLSETTEYYVRPTEPTNTSCPAQPCLTLNQYVSDSDHYFQSNTVFKFLPGTHHMDRPVTIGNVQNMSLENLSDEYPHLVAQFSCTNEAHDCIPLGAWKYELSVCCAAIWLHDMKCVTVRGVILTVQTSNISGVIFRNVSKVTVHLTTRYSSSDRYCLGIAMFEADSVKVQSSSASNCTYGLVLNSTMNSHINDVTTTYNKWGVVLLETHTASITNTIAKNNHVAGFFLRFVNNTNITNTTAIYSLIFGLHLWNMINTNIINTTAAHNGADGMYLDNMNNTRITNVTATHNDWEGIFLYKMNNTSIINTATTYNGWEGIGFRIMNNTRITNITSTLNNGAKAFGELVLSGQITIFWSTHTLIYNSSFTGTSTSRTVTTEDPNSLPVVFWLLQSTLHISWCNFTRNHISAIRGDASNVTMSGNLTFSSNRALAGTAFILVKDSTLIPAENSHIHFLDNYATDTGGVFFIGTNIKYYSWAKNTKCFLNTEGSRSQPRLVFVNNSAGEGGDILYGGEVALGWDGQWNCLDSFKNISNISQNGLSLISSDPSRVCLCNRTGQPDCLTIADPKLHSIYPGQSITISAVLAGQNFGTVAGSVYAQFLPNSSAGSLPQIQTWQKVQAGTQHYCSNLHYTILSQSGVSRTILVLTAHDSYVPKFLKKTDPRYISWVKSYYKASATKPLLYSDNPVYVNISLLACPAGFMLTTHAPFRCDCNRLLQEMHGIQCHIQDQTIGCSGQLWVGMIQANNGANGTLAASKYCSLNYCNQEKCNVTLSQPDSQCNFNHSGILCGGCQPGLSLALGSAQCLPCSNKYLALLIPLTLAGPILVGVIKLLDLTISQGTMNGLIFYGNIVKANEYIFLPQGQTNPLTVFVAWLNLDLGIETCFFHGLSAYSKTWLQFVFPLYVWSIAGLIIILAKYSDRVATVMGNNSVPVLATLILLSYAKIFHTIITALSYSIVYTSHGHKAVWTADGNVEYLGPKHAPLFAIAVGTLLFLWLPYTLLLFLGQWLHMCNCQLISCTLLKIKPFLDTHYGPLKDRHRYWLGALLLARAAILLIQALIPTDHTSTIVLCISVFAIILTHYGQLVYCNLAVSVFDTAFFMNLALLTGTNVFANMVGEDPSVAAYILIGTAFVQFVGLVLFKVFSILKHSERVMACLHKGQPVEEDWEVYEQAALLRGIESDTEEDSEDLESIESLPTY